MWRSPSNKLKSGLSGHEASKVEFAGLAFFLNGATLKTMHKGEVIGKWLEKADYDLSAAESMHRSGHFLYVAFLCQQAAEKTLKAFWCSRKEDVPPYTHNLATLAESMELTLTEKQKNLLDRLNRYYIVGRYPSFKQKMATTLNADSAKDLLSQTKEFVQWCKPSIKI